MRLPPIVVPAPVQRLGRPRQPYSPPTRWTRPTTPPKRARRRQAP
jgi:hypothetical protein